MTGSTPLIIAENLALAWMMSRSVPVSMALQVQSPAAELIRQLQQDAAYLVRFLLFERHDLVVDLDRYSTARGTGWPRWKTNHG